MRINRLEIYSPCIISNKSTVQDAINAFIVRGIIKEQVLPNILFVTNSNSQLLGIVSLSDLCAYFRENNSQEGLSLNITEIMNENPKTIMERKLKQENETIKADGGKECSAFPVVDDNGVLKSVAQYVDDVNLIDMDINDVIDIFNKNGALYAEDGKYSYWFSSIFRNGTSKRYGIRRAMQFILENYDKNATILETGCGLGLFSLWLSEQGYKNLHAADISDKCIGAAKDIARFKNSAVNFFVDDGLKPQIIPEQCDVITALAWVFSVFSSFHSGENGIYLLDNFISNYYGHIKKNGHIIIELEDADIDFWYPNDKRVSHSLADVQSVCKKYNLEILTRYINARFYNAVSCTYFLRKL